MNIVKLAHETDFDGWRDAARRLVLNDVAPSDITWLVDGDQAELFAGTERRPRRRVISAFREPSSNWHTPAFSIAIPLASISSTGCCGGYDRTLSFSRSQPTSTSRRSGR
jgi:hypothetical protein